MPPLHVALLAAVVNYQQTRVVDKVEEGLNPLSQLPAVH